jgi:hypothetical protein
MRKSVILSARLTVILSERSESKNLRLLLGSTRETQNPHVKENEKYHG